MKGTPNWLAQLKKLYTTNHANTNVADTGRHEGLLPAQTDSPIDIVFPGIGTPLTLHSPGLAAMDDFDIKRPQVVKGSLQLDEANRLMVASRVSMKLVVNALDEFIGVLTLADISEKIALVKLHRLRLSIRDIQVQEVMRPTEQLRFIDIDQLMVLKVKDLLDLVQGPTPVEHLLVLQASVDGGNNQLRGIITAAKLTQRLAMNPRLKPVQQILKNVTQNLSGRFD